MKQKLIDYGLVLALLFTAGMFTATVSGCSQEIAVTATGGGVDNSQPAEEVVEEEESADPIEVVVVEPAV